jgi:hypothetical protein
MRHVPNDRGDVVYLRGQLSVVSGQLLAVGWLFWVFHGQRAERAPAAD